MELVRALWAAFSHRVASVVMVVTPKPTNALQNISSLVKHVMDWVLQTHKRARLAMSVTLGQRRPRLCVTRNTTRNVSVKRDTTELHQPSRQLGRAKVSTSVQKDLTRATPMRVVSIWMSSMNAHAMKDTVATVVSAKRITRAKNVILMQLVSM